MGVESLSLTVCGYVPSLFSKTNQKEHPVMDKKDNKAKYHKVVQNNFYAPINHYYEYIENNYAGNAPQGEEEPFPQLPTTGQMKQAVEATVTQGYWWASRAWAVVYRVWQMKGYMKSYADFAREVGEWGLKTGFECTYDAIQKPIAQGMFSGLPDKWTSQGAPGQAVKLAEALLDELNKLT